MIEFYAICSNIKRYRFMLSRDKVMEVDDVYKRVKGVLPACCETGWTVRIADNDKIVVSRVDPVDQSRTGCDVVSVDPVVFGPDGHPLLMSGTSTNKFSLHLKRFPIDPEAKEKYRCLPISYESLPPNAKKAVHDLEHQYISLQVGLLTAFGTFR